MANRGGARPGAGRKSDGYWQRVNDLLGQTVLPSDWQSIIYSLVQRAREGDIRAAQLLLTYHFGDSSAAAAEESVPPAGAASAPAQPAGHSCAPRRIARGFRIKP